MIKLPQNRLSRCRGVFSIEFAIILFALCGIMFFLVDVGMQIVNKAHLDRLSYSLVTIIKDRKKIGFPPNVTSRDCSALKEIADRLSGFEVGVSVQAVASPGTVLGERLPVIPSNCAVGPKCQIKPIPDELILLRKPSLKFRKTDTYQVTVCNQIPSTFSQYFEGLSDQFSQQSSSVMIGRNIDPK